MISQPLNDEQLQVQPCQYEVGKTLGVGTSSEVIACIHIKTGRHYAAKITKKPMTAARIINLRNEISILAKISTGHRNILSLIDCFETANNFYFVTDLAHGGELFHRICRQGPYCESDAVARIGVILSAVAYIHDHNVVHRDLKPENILFRTFQDDTDLVIADFGDSCIIDDRSQPLTSLCGTLGYMAPEMITRSGHGKSLDIWAIGAITYFVLCGYTPFERDTYLEEIHASLIADYSFTPVECWNSVSNTARHFIQRCLTIAPSQRMTSHEALQHPWLTLKRTNI